MRGSATDWIGENAALLASSAIQSGLGSVRPRSPPDRLRREAESFVRMVRFAADGMQPEMLGAVLERETRTGCFAAASRADLPGYFRVWRKATSGAGRGKRGQALRSALREIERRASLEVPKRLATRIDAVLLGGSAGGIASISRILARLDASIPVTVLIVLHVGARSVLSEVLQRSSGIPVRQAEDRMPLLLGQAFVAPPLKHLAVRDRLQRLDDRPEVHFSKPSIDVLFSTAARDLKGRVLAAVVSGTGHDGLDGAAAVRREGGIVLVEDPVTAQFPGMPQELVTARAADRILGPDRIGDLISILASGGNGALNPAVRSPVPS